MVDGSGGARWRKARLALVLVGLLLAAELAARIVTYRRWTEPLRNHPELARRTEPGHGGLARMTVDDLFRPPEEMPVTVFRLPEKEPVGTTTYGEYPPSAFPAVPKTDAPAPGTVRVACVGDSVVFDGWPASLQRLCDARFGAGKVEVLNLGMPGSTLRANEVVLAKYLPRWRPHVVVAYSGRNDLAIETARARAVVAQGLGLPLTPERVYRVRPRSVGLLGLLRPAEADWQPERRAAAWIDVTAERMPMTSLWELSRLSWSLGARFYVSTYAAASDASEEARTAYDLEIRYVWPVFGDLAGFRARVEALNAELRAFPGADGVVDVAGALTHGKEDFNDVVHETLEGKQRHAQAVLERIGPVVEELLEQGALPPEGPRKTEEIRPLALPPEGLPEVPGDGTCVEGPCGAGMCLVPKVTSTWGYDDAVLAEAAGRAKAAYGFAALKPWYGDDGPPTMVTVSAFCLDRFEATGARQKACVSAGLCPPIEGADDLPAVVPTRADAEALCAFEGKRLPTDAEWEAAGRGADGRALPWGGPWTGKEANACGSECPWGLASDPSDGVDGPAKPGAFAGAGPFGHADLAGNQWEWVYDCFRDDVHRALGAEAMDPVVPPAPGCRWIIRGGSWRSLPGFLEKRTPQGMVDTDAPTRGVRCARDFGTAFRPVPGRTGR